LLLNINQFLFVLQSQTQSYYHNLFFTTIDRGEKQQQTKWMAESSN